LSSETYSTGQALSRQGRGGRVGVNVYFLEFFCSLIIRGSFSIVASKYKARGKRLKAESSKLKAISHKIKTLYDRKE